MSSDDPGTRMRCEVTVAGPVADGVLAHVGSRFDVTSTPGSGGDTVLVVDGADQATQRAFLTLLWDHGTVVRRLVSTPC
jgi:hypothetical protein